MKPQVRKFIKLHNALLQERVRIEARLGEISQALKDGPVGVAAAAPAPKKARRKMSAAGRANIIAAVKARWARARAAAAGK